MYINKPEIVLENPYYSQFNTSEVKPGQKTSGNKKVEGWRRSIRCENKQNKLYF